MNDDGYCPSGRAQTLNHVTPGFNVNSGVTNFLLAVWMGAKRNT